MKEEQRRLILGIDLDGTVWDAQWPAIGALRPNADKVLRRLYDGGHDLVIWTARAYPPDVQAAKDTLEAYGIKYHSFNEPSETMKRAYTTGSRKLHFDVLLDDVSLLGIPHDWEDIYTCLVQYHGIEDLRTKEQQA